MVKVIAAMPSAVSLPPGLAAAVAEGLAGRGGRALRSGAKGLTEAYRAGHASAESMDFGAYLAARLPATYAAVSRALEELRQRRPGFGPTSLVDAGSGPGTASWAAAEIWPDIQSFTFVDSNPAFMALAKGLAAASGRPALRGATALLQDIGALSARGELVVASYALAESAEDKAAAIARGLWQAAGAALVIVEPGTPQGFARIRRAREALIEAGAAIAAPCPHDRACPMAGGDWCHFSVRLPRTRLHMQAKAASVPFEDERYSYVIATRDQPSPAAARILSPPAAGKAGIRLRLCTAAGLETPMIARRDAAAYKRARKLDWGDAW